MASIKQWENGIVARWDKDDWTAGLAATYGASQDTRPTDGMNLTTAVDPFRRYGFLSPGYTPTDATNVSEVTAILKNGVVSGNKAYCIEGGNLLHEVAVATTTPTIQNTGSWPHTIAPHGGHTTVVGEDVIRYSLNGTPYIFYSWNDNTDGDIGRYDISATFDDDYVSTAATSGAVLNKNYPHPMTVGDDNILYVGDGPNVASLQGSTSAGIWNPSALDLPDDYVITSFAKTRLFLVIYAYQTSDPTFSAGAFLRGKTTAFFWDYTSDSFTYAYDMTGNYVNGGFNIDGVPGCFVFGKSADNVNAKQSKMLLFNGSNFDTVVDFTDDIPGHGGVEVSGNTIFWNSDGHIYSYGTPFVGRNNSLQRLYKGDGTTGRGMLRNFLGTSLQASSGTGTSGGLNVFLSGFNEGSSAYTGQKQLPTSSRETYQVMFMRVGYFNKVDSATATNFAIAINSDDNGSTTSNQRGQFVYVYENESGAASDINQIIKIYDKPSGVSSTGDLPRVTSSLGIFMNWAQSGQGTTDAPCVEYVEVYMKPITQAVTDEN